MQAISNESGADNRSLYVGLARLLASYLRGCPDDVLGMITLCRRPAWLFQNVDCAIEDARLVDESGHEPFVDEADKFNASMADLVRPVAVQPWEDVSAFRPYHPVVRRCSEVMVSAISCTKLDVASNGAAWPAPSIDAFWQWGWPPLGSV